MYAQWVEVLHRGYCEAMVVGITYHLKLNFLPSFQALLHKNLRSKCECALCNLLECLLVWTNTRTETTKGVSRTYHYREANAAGSLYGRLHSLASLAHRHFQINLVELLYEEVTVLSVHDSLYAGTKHLYAIFLQHARLIQLCTAVQRCLSTERQKYTVRAFLFYHFSYEMSVYRQEIHLVCNTLTRLNGCYVRIDKHTADTLFAQGFQSLRTRIVKLSGLTNFQSA